MRFAKESFVCRIVVPQNHLRNARPFCSIAETRRRYLAASLADRLRYRSFAGFSSFRPRSPRAKDYSLWLDDYQTHVRCYFCYYYLPRPYYASLLGDPVTSILALRYRPLAESCHSFFVMHCPSCVLIATFISVNTVRVIFTVRKEVHISSVSKFHCLEKVYV